MERKEQNMKEQRTENEYERTETELSLYDV
jgi:hypothetical protein